MQKRRLLVVGAAFCTLLLALFLVPTVRAWRTATVDSYTTGTFYPQTVTASTATPAPLLSCEQTSGTTVPTLSINLTKNTSTTASYFSCTNNWGSPVTFTISVEGANGTGLSVSASGTVQPGRSSCIPGRVTTINSNGGDVMYLVSATATDLSATLHFAGNFKTPGGDSPPCSLP